MRRKPGTNRYICQPVLLILSVFLVLLGTSCTTITSPSSWPSPMMVDDESADEESEDHERLTAPEPAIARFLNSIQGDPKLLTLQELRELRKSIPTVVENFVKIVNSERLANDVKYGQVTPEQLYDLQNSLIFLNSEPCHRLTAERSKKCLSISKPIRFPKEPIFSARLSGIVYPWVDVNNIFLTIYLYYPDEREFRGNVLQIGNATQSTDLSQKRGTEGPLLNADIHFGHQVSWDVTIAILDLQRKQELHPYPVYLVLSCPQDNCSHRNLLLQPLYQNELRDPRVLIHNSQTVLEVHTKPTVALLNNYSQKKSIFHRNSQKPTETRLKRSNEDNTQCPSFLEEYSQQTKCCLFRFTLSKQQIESNDKLRFIISPERIPMNVCHGRCIGVDSTTTNSHSFLMNQYYAGLSYKEQNLIYDAMPCCSASKARNFTIVYIKRNGHFVKKTLQNAIKEECSCN